jgi:two-component system chemotaxis response regulator CheB
VPKVLIVDDSALMRRALGDILAGGGFQVETARDGREALERLDVVNPDVVTLDIHMPAMDGLECLSRIMVARPVPVVMVSSITAKGAAATLEALALGAVDFVEKPGGSVSTNMREAAEELVAKVRAAAGARPAGVGRSAPRAAHAPAARRAPVAPQPREHVRPAQRASLRAAPGGGFPVLVIGASTGGPRVLEAVLCALPRDFPAAIVVAQHMPQAFTGVFARRLNETSAIRIAEADRRTRLEPGLALIARGDADMRVTGRGDTLYAAPCPAAAGAKWRPSVNALTASLREAGLANRTVCALMTGMGDDGAAEMAQMKALGAPVIAESQDSAAVWGMPGALVGRGGATAVVAAAAMADEIMRAVADVAARGAAEV